MKTIFNNSIIALLPFAVLQLGVDVAFAQTKIATGITEPVNLPAFDPSAPTCARPAGLSRKLIFFQDNSREFMQGVRFGLEQAAKARALSFTVDLANDDASKMAEGVDKAVKSKTGALVAAPVDAIGLAPHLQAAITSGTYVGTVVPPPAVTILNAPQYLTGERLALAASDYIVHELGGQANVVLLTHDSLQFLSPRFKAMRDVLGKLPGVTIVADISPATVNMEGGYETMKLILLAHPKIDVVLGADTVVLGALKALKEAGLASTRQFLGGIDGEPAAVSELKDSQSPYKVSVSLASPVFGYALGHYAADWLEGKSVPQAMDVLPKVLTPDILADYEADLKDPASVFSDPEKHKEYLREYGNICFDSRDRFLNFPWSSDR
ncbi:sugar ABC transporter substrate-binding protein (plasmid) [Rhizobium sp. TH2]|uniref:sugar ABC transporter substrate-binding protein n=1 Tax=Rhizobium sp. TH2 TaxID=2775403 RepID=UPI0021572A21|nr:sugar ABC transporter substrate-binding protein [Rhizobium sp. TH2]UVC12552.1 sugar ABC transporter substrate-binding protein [Rhizobium sp. TH2]